MARTRPVQALEAFGRSTENVDSTPIFYPKLDQYAQEAIVKERPIWDEFWNAAEGSADEVERARALAIGYFVLTGAQMQIAARRHKYDVSKRFTEAAVELYDQPDPKEARRLAAQQYYELARDLGNPNVDQDRLKRVLYFLEFQLGEVPAKHEEDEDFSESLEKIHEAFIRRHSEALGLFDNIDTVKSFTPIEEVKQLFTKGIDALTEEEPAWKNISVVFTDKKSMGYSIDKHQVQIGEKGSYRPKRLKRLFIEEVLVHAQRSVMGSKTGDYLMEHGLPGFGAAEEGLAKFLQVAMGSVLGNRSKDFYIDTAFALGQTGRAALGRPVLVEIYTDKEVVRKQSCGKDVDIQQIKDKAWRYANRIYRGSLGDEHVAVNTKDIGYYKGYITVARYIDQALKAGVNPDELLDYLLSGKFDPTNEKHTEHVNQFVDSPLDSSGQELFKL